MSDTESPAEPQIEMTIENVAESETIKPKSKRKRKPMSAEHKAKALASLAKAREASKLKRAKKAQAKKFIKAQEDEEVDRILDAHIENKKKNETEKDKEIARLKKRLDGLTLQDIIKKPKKAPSPIPEESEPEPEPEPESEPEPEPIQSKVVVQPPRQSQPKPTVPAVVKPRIKQYIVRPKKKPRM